MRPSILILAGGNSAGKTTAAPELRHGTLAVNEFVSAHIIARDLSAFDPDSVAIAAGGAPFGGASLLKPNGTSLGSAQMSTLAGFMEPKTLTDTGTHTVKVDPSDWNTGTAVVTLYNVPADLSGTLTVNASATNVSLSTPGQNATYTFSGTASQLITVRITSNTMGVTVKLLKPDGTTLTQSISGSTNFNLTQQTLPATGTYSVVIDPSTTSTGSLNVQVTNP